MAGSKPNTAIDFRDFNLSSYVTLPSFRQISEVLHMQSVLICSILKNPRAFLSLLLVHWCLFSSNNELN